MRDYEPELHLLRCISSPVRTPEAVQEAVDACRDWELALQLARRHNILPQLAMYAAAAPEPVRGRLASLRERFLFVDRSQVMLLGRVLDAMQFANVPVMVLKGHSLAERFYATPDERIGVDLDLLVPAASRKQAGEIMRELDFEPCESEFYDETHFHTPWRQRDAAPLPCAVELHWELSPPSSPVQFDARGWWLRTDARRLRAGETQLPLPHLEIVHLAWHAFNAGSITLRDLSDIARLWPQTDPGAARTYAAETGTLGFLRQALRLAEATWELGLAREENTPWISRGLLDPDTVLLAGDHRWSPLRRICYWSLLPADRVGLGFLWRDALLDLEQNARREGRGAPRADKLTTLTALAAGLVVCALPYRPLLVASPSRHRATPR